MNHYVIIKTGSTCTLDKALRFKNGFPFKHRLKITLYESNIIHYVLIKKLNDSLKKIINLYLMHESDDANDSMGELLPSIEYLRKILINHYALHLTEIEIESYLIKLDKLENKIGQKLNKKTRHR